MQIRLNVLGHVLKERRCRAAASWTRRHLRRERAQPKGLKDLLRNVHFFGAIAARARRQRHTNRVANTLSEQNRKRRRAHHRALHAQACFRKAKVQGIIAADREKSVDIDQVGHARDLCGQNDAIVREPCVLGELSRTQRALEHGFDIDVARIARARALGVLVHERRKEILVERAPVHPDTDGLVVRDGDLHYRTEVFVASLAAHIAGIDPVLCERAGARGVAVEQQVPVVVEVADERDFNTGIGHPMGDILDGGGGFRCVDGNAYELGSGSSKSDDLRRC